MWTIFEIAINFVESIIIIDFITRYLGVKSNVTKPKIKVFIAVMTLFLIVTATNHLKSGDFVSLLSYFMIVFIYSIFILKGKIWNKLFVSLSTLLLIILTNSIVILLISIITNKPSSIVMTPSLIRIYAVVLAKLIFFYETRIVLKIKQKDARLVRWSDWLLLLVNPLLSFFAVAEVMNVEINYINETTGFNVALIISNIVFMNIATYIMYMQVIQNSRAALENHLLKQQAEYQHEHVDEVKNLYSQIQTIRHDLKNHMICVSELLKHDKYEQAEQYLDKEVSEINNIRKYVETDNEVINCILNEKISKAIDKGIKVSFQVIKEEINIEPYDICVLLSNLLDNAIEACVKSDKKEKYINILIERKIDFIIINITNTVDENILELNPEMQTTKQNKNMHGFGIKSCKNITEKYDGTLEYKQKGPEFICNAILQES